MFSGTHEIKIEDNGRLAIPSCYRKFISEQSDNHLVVTVSPRDRVLWFYPSRVWKEVEQKLSSLPDFDHKSYRVKQMMLGQSNQCHCDKHGRILIPKALREYAMLKKQALMMGQYNKLELWDVKKWDALSEEWLKEVDDPSSPASEALMNLSL